MRFVKITQDCFDGWMYVPVTVLGFCLGTAAALLSEGYAVSWIATAIGTGLSVLSSLYGGAKAADASSEAERENERQRARDNAWFRYDYRTKYGDTAAGQNIINRAMEIRDEAIRSARGQQRVAGQTDASAALAKEKANKAVGTAISTIAANDTSRKQAAAQSHRARQAQLSTQYQNNQLRKAQQTQLAAGQASNAMMQAGPVIDTAGKAKAPTAGTTGALSMENYQRAGNTGANKPLYQADQTLDDSNFWDGFDLAYRKGTY